MFPAKQLSPTAATVFPSITDGSSGDVSLPLYFVKVILPLPFSEYVKLPVDTLLLSSDEPDGSDISDELIDGDDYSLLFSF